MVPAAGARCSSRLRGTAVLPRNPRLPQPSSRGPDSGWFGGLGSIWGRSSDSASIGPEHSVAATDPEGDGGMSARSWFSNYTSLPWNTPRKSASRKDGSRERKGTQSIVTKSYRK